MPIILDEIMYIIQVILDAIFFYLIFTYINKYVLYARPIQSRKIKYNENKKNNILYPYRLEDKSIEISLKYFMLQCQRT